MIRVLAVLIWPAGIAAIAGAGALTAWLGRRGGPVGHVPGASPPPPPASGLGRRDRAWFSPPGPMAPRIALSCAVLLTGTAAISAVVIALGLAARHAGPAIDGPIFHWTVTHQLSAWHRVMASLTKIGGAWETRAAAAAAAVCLIAGYRAQRWLPPAALGALIVGNHFLSPVIKHVVHRVPPPGAGGMFPSGGAERAVVFYGLIAYLLWRGFSGTRHGAIWAATGVAAVAFHEGYSRGYLAVHWFTDILGGWVYGALLLAVFIIAINVAAGPARKVPRLVQSQIQVRGPAIVPAEADLPL